MIRQQPSMSLGARGPSFISSSSFALVFKLDNVLSVQPDIQVSPHSAWRITFQGSDSNPEGTEASDVLRSPSLPYLKSSNVSSAIRTAPTSFFSGLFLAPPFFSAW